MVSGADVVAEARRWIGTPHRHQQRMRGEGVDCVGLVIGVARALRIVPAWFDVSGYPRQPDGSLLRECHRHMRELQREDMQPGDVIVVAFGPEPQHMGIVGDYLHSGLSIIHAMDRPGGAGKVVEHRLVLGTQMRFVGVFALPEVTRE